MTRRTDLTTLISERGVDQLRIPSLDGWTIDENESDPIGIGQFGEVFKYRTPLAEWPFAAGKQINLTPYLFNLDKASEKTFETNLGDFLDEIKLLHDLASANSDRIIKPLRWYLDTGKIIIFTELAHGGSIKEKIDLKPLEEKTALKYFRQACEAVRNLHNREGPKRIVHRDRKCENLLLTEEDSVKLADFGLAYLLVVNDLLMTQSSSAADEEAGSDLFIAPEVLAGEKYGRGADIWSLACTLVEMLTGHPPHQDTWADYARNKGPGALQLFKNAIISTEPGEKIEYSGQLAPNASEDTRLMLDCLFTKNRKLRPKIDCVLNLFESTETNEVVINHDKVLLLKNEIKEKSAII